MSAAIAILPTDAALEAAWNRYTAIARRVVDNPELMLERGFCTDLALAWGDWRDLMLARRLM